MTLMTDLQRTFVRDRIADLQREAAALRAERVRDLGGHAAAGADPTVRSATLTPGRVRLGRLLVAIGQRIAGSRPVARSAPPLIAASMGAEDDPCGDGHDRLAPAA